jgi:hypothetical protein
MTFLILRDPEVIADRDEEDEPLGTGGNISAGLLRRATLPSTQTDNAQRSSQSSRGQR